MGITASFIAHKFTFFFQDFKQNQAKKELFSPFFVLASVINSKVAKLLQV